MALPALCLTSFSSQYSRNSFNFTLFIFCFFFSAESRFLLYLLCAVLKLHSPFGYEEAFSFNGRGIHSLTIPEEGFNIHLFLDTDLLAQEIADVTKRTEKKNNAAELKKGRETARRLKGKGRLTDEELEALVPITIQEAYADKEEMGTITLKTNRLDLNAFQVYSIYKQRQAIEQFFKTYGDTI